MPCRKAKIVEAFAKAAQQVLRAAISAKVNEKFLLENSKEILSYNGAYTMFVIWPALKIVNEASDFFGTLLGVEPDLDRYRPKGCMPSDHVIEKLIAYGHKLCNMVTTSQMTLDGLLENETPLPLARASVLNQLRQDFTWAKYDMFV